MTEGQIETHFAAAIEAGKINGAIICATDAKGQFVYNKTTGERTLLSGEKKPHQLDDVLFLASATKLMATIAALTCIEDGLLSLTGDLSDLAPELTNRQVLLGFTEQDKPILEPSSNPITLEMLLTHSSGLVYHFIDPKIARWRNKYGPQAQDSDTNTPKKRKVEDSFTYPLVFHPGTSWIYGPSLDWAGCIVERATGNTLLIHLQNRVFNRLGITDAQFHPVTRPDLRERMVDLNPSDPDGLGAAVTGGSADMNKVTQGDFGGHGLFMTAQDYIKVLYSLLANDGQILKPETVDSMFVSYLSPLATEGLAAACAGPVGPFFRVGHDPGTPVSHGLGGLLTVHDIEEWYGANTLSWGGGLTFAWFIDRKNDLCGLAAIQAKMPVDGQVIAELKQTFRHDIYRKHQDWLSKENAK